MSKILLYKTANQEIKLEVLIQNETIWLNQKQLCELFGRDKSVISRHTDFDNLILALEKK